MFKKIALICILSCFAFTPSGKKMYKKERYQSGIIKAEGWVLHSKRINYWKYYHPNGKLEQEGHFKNGKKEKYWYFYRANGLKSMEGHFNNDKKDGWWLFYDQQGKIDYKCQMENGIKNGYCLQYTNNKISSAEKYQNGNKIAEWFDLKSFKRDNNIYDLR